MNWPLYLLGMLITTNLVIVAFHTNITVHLFNLLCRTKFFVREDVSNHLMAEEKFTLNEWYSCPLCFGTWVAASTGFCLGGFTLAIAGLLSWPVVAYIVMRRIETWK